MTEGEARQLMKKHGWNWHLHKRRKGTLYIYARRRKKKTIKKFESRYIAPLSKLPALTEEDIINKLTT